MICTTLNAVRQHDPCADGWAKLLAHLGKTGPDDEPLPLVTILDSNGLDDALWALRAVTGEDARIRRYAVWCARQVQHLMTDQRSLRAVAVAERHADGLATDDDLRTAWAAAGAAVGSAVGSAAGAAARAAAWAAVGAAAGSAARAAAGAAAWAAVGSAAGAAVVDAMRERQATRFREVFGEQEVGVSDETTEYMSPLDEIDRLRNENAALRAAVERVRALHVGEVRYYPNRDGTVVCSTCNTPYPCPTLRALEDTPEFACPMCWRSYQNLTDEEVSLYRQRGWCCDYCRAEGGKFATPPQQKEGTP